MRRATFLIVMISSLAMLATATALAQDGRPEIYPFQLTDDSNFQVGCVDPCLCPTLQHAVRGRFKMVPRGYDGLFFTYSVLDVQWELPKIDGRVIKVEGSGTYQIGGEVAPTQRMRLDLSVAGRPVQHFDSGIVVGGQFFPRIKISIAVNEFVCYDSVFVLRAEALVALAVGDEPGAPGRLQAQPNPFRGKTEVAFSLTSPSAVSLSVIDIGGRQVSTLIESAMFPAGRHAVAWKGHDEDGRDSPPGIYFVRLDVGGRPLVRRLVKLE